MGSAKDFLEISSQFNFFHPYCCLNASQFLFLRIKIHSILYNKLPVYKFLSWEIWCKHFLLTVLFIYFSYFVPLSHCGFSLICNKHLFWIWIWFLCLPCFAKNTICWLTECLVIIRLNQTILLLTKKSQFAVKEVRQLVDMGFTSLVPPKQLVLRNIWMVF